MVVNIIGGGGHLACPFDGALLTRWNMKRTSNVAHREATLQARLYTAIASIVEYARSMIATVQWTKPVRGARSGGRNRGDKIDAGRIINVLVAKLSMLLRLLMSHPASSVHNTTLGVPIRI